MEMRKVSWARVHIVDTSSQRVTAIMARPNPVIHPADRALLKPLSSLGKGAGAGGAVSFLRRTEYTSSQGTQQLASSALTSARPDLKKRKQSTDKENPVTIIRNITKGFDIAYPKDAFRGEDSTTNIRGQAPTDAENQAWQKPRHPTKPEVTLLDSYPILPDLDALPTAASYVVAKFTSNPAASQDGYDVRLDAAILMPKEDKAAMDKYNQRKAEWTEESGKPGPMPEDDYDFFLPIEAATSRGLKRKLDPNDPDNDDPELYTDDNSAFRYTRLRTYETYGQTADANHHYDDSVALALHDPDIENGAGSGARNRLPKGAYFYPVLQRTALRPKRIVNTFGQASQMVEGETIDELSVKVMENDEATRETLLRLKAQLDPSIAVPEATQAVEATA